MWAWVRSNAHEILPRKIPSLHALTLFLRLGDALVNLFLNLRLRLWNDGNVAVELSDTLDDEAAQFITMRNGSELTRRGVAELRWIVERPWILSASAAEPGRYYFSSVAREFSCRFVKVRDASNQLVALMMLSHRDGHVTVPYCYCDAANVEMMARAVGRILFESKASMFTCFNAELIDRLERIGFPFLYKRQITRPWIVSAKFKGIDFTKTTVQDGDGDCAFT